MPLEEDGLFEDEEHEEYEEGLCTFSLRVIPIARKPGTMPPFTISVRGALP
jgi:hypothetical protein